MPTTTPRYAYDPTGVNADNLVAAEVHELSANNIRAVAPLYGAFFTDSIIVYDNVTDQPLTKGTQYKTVELLQEATLRIGKEICTLILIMDRNVSSAVRITYQALGGMYQNDSSGIRTMYETIAMDNRSVDWVNVLNKPLEYPTTLHQHILSEIYGFEPVVDSLERVRQAIILSNVPAFETLADWVNSRFGETGQSISNVVASISDLTASIASEQRDRIAGDTHLQDLIDSNTGQTAALNQEIIDRTAADAALGDTLGRTISTEINDRTNADTVLRNSINAITTSYGPRLTTIDSTLVTFNNRLLDVETTSNNLNNDFLRRDGSNTMTNNLTINRQNPAYTSPTGIRILTNDSFYIASYSLNAASNGNHQTFMAMEGDQIGFYSSITNALTNFSDADVKRKLLATLDTATGEFTATGDIAAFSDPRLKDVAGNIKNALEIVHSLNGVFFTWNEVSDFTRAKWGKKDVGLLANEVKHVLPEAVSISKVDPTTNETYDLVAYDKLVPVLIEAIKQLSTRVIALEAKTQIY